MDASIWDQILSRVETKVNRHSFYTWFKPTALVTDGGTAITVRVPNPLFKDWLTKHYLVVLSEALIEVHRPAASLVFVTEDAPTSALPPSEEEPPAPEPGSGVTAASSAGARPARAGTSGSRASASTRRRCSAARPAVRCWNWVQIDGR